MDAMFTSFAQPPTPIKAEPLSPHSDTQVATSPPPFPPPQPLRAPIVPTIFYTLSLSKDTRMSPCLLSQAFNVTTPQLSTLLNTASINLAENDTLDNSSRSKVTKSAQHKAVLAAIHSLPLFKDFFERWIRNHARFVVAMCASIVRICVDEFRAWQGRKRREEVKDGNEEAGRDGGEKKENQEAAVVGKDGWCAVQKQLPTPPATPRKRTPTAKTSVKGFRVAKRGVTKLRLQANKKVRLSVKQV